jgi:hypothetical protein
MPIRKVGILHNRSKVMRTAAVLLLLTAVVALGATERLYLKDGTYQLTREYQVLQDRVRYYSTERGEWEEIPLDLVDLDRSKKEAAERQTQLETDAKAQAEEDAAVRAAREQVEHIPTENGAYYIQGDQLHAIKVAESKIVNNKKRSVLKMLSPIPLVPGKATVELDGEHATLRVTGDRPEFYFRLSDYEQFGIVKLGPKKGVRVVENLSILSVQGQRDVDEQQEIVPTFKKQEADLLYRIWPEKPLEPGEYALIQFTPGKINPQIWDFGVDRSK